MENKYYVTVNKVEAITDVDGDSIRVFAKNKYREYMKDIKFQIEYVDLNIDKSHTRDMILSVVTIITSAVGIAGWSTWPQYSIAWGIIIAISQLVTAIQVFLPYKDTVKVLNNVLSELQKLFIITEHEWNKIQIGKMSAEEILESLNDIKKRDIEIQNMYYNSIVLINNDKLTEKANSRVKIYFSED